MGHRSRRRLAPGRPTWDIGLDANLLLDVPRGTSVSTPTCSWTSHVGHRSRRQLAPVRPTWDIGLDANLLLDVPRGTPVSTPTCSWTSQVGHRLRDLDADQLLLGITMNWNGGCGLLTAHDIR